VNVRIELLTLVLALALASAASVLPVPVAAAEAQDEASPQKAAGLGTVRAVDLDGGTVTLKHEAIAALGWPAMTMKFSVASASLLENLQVGERIRFELENRAGKPVITKIEHP
jgi:Cu/Ag efflux protein CusF